MTADVTALARLGADLARAAVEVSQGARGVVSKGALNIKNDWRTNAIASSGVHARAYPYSVGYDLLLTPIGAAAVIGPDKDAVQGPLGNLLEYGSVNNPPHNDGGRALLAEEPKFLAAAQALADGALQ